ncbi:autophagy-related protein [Cercophora newfieldiana]|uniref:Autophagy-related protein 101 n=1 Tax=Cercophora newfieldiana TaxID=92897 RepID=A0AA39Y4L4_9PEZI|nr:autophagy-related protein [Cercophora newfieldiana]
MEPRGAPEFILEAFADPNSVRDVVRGILNLIFFLRFFPTVPPRTRDVLGLDLAYVAEDEIETLIEQRVTTLVRQLEAERSQPHHANHSLQHASSGSGNGGSGRGQVAVKFFEKRRRKAWYPLRSDDEVCWENWVIKVTVADPKTEGERAKVRKATVTTLNNTVFKIITLVNAHKDHIPPITTTDSNPFPYEININPHKSAESGWAARIGIY